MIVIINIADLQKIREKNLGKKIIFCSGVFDLTHAGHALFFEDCKKLGDVLVVLTGNDESIKKYKGETRPIVNEHMRLKMIDSLKPVDYALVSLAEYEKDDDPFAFIKMVIEKLRPDIYAVNNDAFDLAERANLSKKYGTELRVLKRWCPIEFENISTTAIIKKLQNS